ncbi:hypothetical protein N7509_000160 [Penicillium cosmopolitanum]|uniref:Zn(2)-C6 fungal-type domain-containing protein n=1 Tax=Penicillium cosmopolitanum TaxID=1131564 RepID=A0A9X0BF21_9EURO|nr:uncharacterized protein N7509_000160 [Penicillium cosmopolitanum]KAJ5414826.1 hypothetical protein N7509_000160 [Penicillium cosmopolitanum]
MAAMTDSIPFSDMEPKLHAACDECRKRKLKCSGDLSGCTRCLKQSIICHYSVQKQMGRPKKRARADDEGPEYPTQTTNNIWPSPEETPPGAFAMPFESYATPDSHRLCPQLFWQTGAGASGHSPSSQPYPDLLADDEQHNHSWRPERLKNPNVPVPISDSPWPDFSAVTEATATLAMPFPTPTSNLLDATSLPLTPPTSTSSDPAPPMHIHISSVASFPVNSHTICSLYIAARTARDVIRCESCPKVFATGMQNVMFTGTLLTTVADAWLRIWNTDPVELGMQTAPPAFVSMALQSEDPAQFWSSWLRQIVRRAVVGGFLAAEAGTPCSIQPDLLSLIREVENRQRRWHGSGQLPFEGYNPLRLGLLVPIIQMRMRSVMRRNFSVFVLWGVLGLFFRSFILSLRIFRKGLFLMICKTSRAIDDLCYGC